MHWQYQGWKRMRSIDENCLNALFEFKKSIELVWATNLVDLAAID